MKNFCLVSCAVFMLISLNFVACSDKNSTNKPGAETVDSDSTNPANDNVAFPDSDVIPGSENDAPGNDNSTTPDSSDQTDSNTTVPDGEAKPDENPPQPDGTTQPDGASTPDSEPADNDPGSVTDLEKFSFFITSLASLRELSGSQNGFGGDLRYGETGDGAGLRGADKICSEIAEKSMPGASKKAWKAFLSATKDENGKQVNAIDRIGEGPWYDRLGRLVGNNKSELANTRPLNADGTIKQDLPNEWGTPNQYPDNPNQAADNHHMLTGSTTTGTLYGATATCSDWTSTAKTGSKPRVGLSWPRTNMVKFGPGGGMSGSHWISAMDESGCAPGVSIIENGAGTNDGTVGSGGGYGGFYCFALKP